MTAHDTIAPTAATAGGGDRLRQFAAIAAIETRLFLRDPAAWFVTLVLPTAILVVMGAIPALRTPDEQFDGMRFIDFFAPSLLVITVAALGLTALPQRLATYRERGVLRRLSTTPARPSYFLLVHLLVYLVDAVLAVVLLLVVGGLAFDLPVPQNMPGFALAFTVGMATLFALGTLVAAVARTAGTATSLGMPLFFLVMFFGGVYLPRFLLPDWIITIGDYAPPGVQALLDTWSGATPQVAPLAIMGAVAVVASLVAAKLFRWE